MSNLILIHKIEITTFEWRRSRCVKFELKLRYDLDGISTIFELTNASKRRKCYILLRRMLQYDPADSLELLLTFAETPADVERLTGGNSTRGCANMRVVGYIHQGEPGHAIIRRRPTVALRWDVMLTFQKKKSVFRRTERRNTAQMWRLFSWNSSIFYTRVS